MKRDVGSKVVRWLAVAAICAMPLQSYALSVNTNDIVNGAVTTPKIADGAVTAAKLGITCTSGQYLQFNGATWECSVGTAGPQGPAGQTPHYANVIVVAKSGGDFTDVGSALASIIDASATNPYLVKVMPGIYTVTSPVNMKPFVDVEGSGESVTKLTGTVQYTVWNNAALLHGASNTELRNITLENTGIGTEFQIRGIHNFNNVNAKYSNVTISIASSSGSAVAMYNWAADVRFNNVSMTVTSDSREIYGLINYASSTAQFNNLSMKIAGLGASDASWSKYGIMNYGTSTLELNSSAISLSNLNGPVIAISASNGIVKARNSVLSAPTAIESDAGAGSVYVNNSEIDGLVAGPITCFASFNAAYQPACQ